MKKQTVKKEILKKIKSGEIKMKPKWFFLLGSVLSVVGLISSFVFTAFIINLIIFILKPHYGPNYPFQINLILKNFPWWLLVLSLISLISGIFFLKKFDFSYKKNSLFVFFIIVFSIIIGAIFFDRFGLNDLFIKRGPRFMRQFFRNIQPNNIPNFQRQKFNRF